MPSALQSIGFSLFFLYKLYVKYILIQLIMFSDVF